MAEEKSSHLLRRSPGLVIVMSGLGHDRPIDTGPWQVCSPAFNGHAEARL